MRIINEDGDKEWKNESVGGGEEKVSRINRDTSGPPPPSALYWSLPVC